MATTQISQQKALDAARLIQQLIEAQNPDIDVSPGSMLYDAAVNALAYISAYLVDQRDVIKNLLSLLRLRNLPEDENVSAAADAILANWFLTRPSGTFARGVATLHLSQRVDLTVRFNTKIYKTSGLVYFPDTENEILISQSQMRPVIDARGNTSEWTCTFPIVAARAGVEYNQLTPGPFIAYDRFSPYITSIEHQTPITSGTSAASTADFLLQANTAISVRTPINARSNDVTLRQRFSDIERVVTVGMGDPEMSRDIVREVASGFALHIGGHMDVYARLPVQETTETLTVGGRFIRNDNLAVVLRDTGRGFLAAGVQPTDVLVITSGLPEAPFEFTVAEVNDDYITVSSRTPFTVPTDEDSTADPIMYTIGNNYPAYNNKISDTGGVPVQAAEGTSRTIQMSGRVFLAARPVYQIKKIEMTNVPLRLEPFRNAQTNSVLFEKRVNGPNARGVPGRPLTYRVNVLNPEAGQTGLALTSVDIGWPGSTFDGLEITITYDSVVSFSTIDSYVRDPLTRVAVANTALRGLHPVYIGFTIPYSLTTDPATIGLEQLGTFDEANAAAELESFVSKFQSNDELDFSLLATEARAQSGLLGSIGTFPITYTLYAPDGRVFNYSTTDKISIFADPTANGATLLNPTDVGLPSTNYTATLKSVLSQLGVSSRTVRYVCPSGSVSFLRRS